MSIPEWKAERHHVSQLVAAKSWLNQPGPVELPDRVRQWMHDHFAAELDKARQDDRTSE